MRNFVQAVIIGILTGGVYALMASGQTLIFGIMKVINLAQGAMVIVGAFLSYSLFVHFGIDPFLSILITTPLLFGIGVLIQLAFLRRLRSDDAAEMSLLVTFAVALGIEGVLTLTYKTNYRSIQTSYANKSFDIGGYEISAVRLYAFILSLVALVVLYFVLERTRLGRAIRATVQNPTSALLLGVDSTKGRRDRIRPRCCDSGGSRRGVRAGLRVQSQQPLRPDLTPAVDRDSRRPRQYRRSCDRGTGDGSGVEFGRGLRLAGVE